MQNFVDIDKVFRQILLVVKQFPTFENGFYRIIVLSPRHERIVQLADSVLLRLQVLQALLIEFLRLGIFAGALIDITQIHLVARHIRISFDLLF